MSTSTRLLVTCVVLLWGFNFVVIRWGIEGVDPITMTALRFLFTAFPMIFFVKRPNVPMPMVALYGVLFGGGLWGLVNLAVSLHTPAGYASLLLQLSAFLTVLAAVVFFKESISKQKMLGIAIAFCGFLIVVMFRGEAVSMFGVTLVLLAAVFWTACNVIIRTTKPTNVVSFVVWSSLFVPIPIVLAALGQQMALDGEISWLNVFELPGLKGWASILFQSFATTLFGYGVWTSAITKHGLANVVPYSLLVPISGLFFGWLLYGETLTPVELMGSGLIIVGLMLLSITRSPWTQAKAPAADGIYKPDQRRSKGADA